MNVAYNEISCADAARMIGTDYTTIAKWCKAGKINCNNVSGGTTKARYLIKEDEVEYIKKLRQKFGKEYMKKYRKDWRRGQQIAQDYAKRYVEKDDVPAECTKPIATIKSVVTNITTEESPKKKADIDELAIKIGYIQDIKEKLDALDAQKNQLTAELEGLRKEVMEYL